MDLINLSIVLAGVAFVLHKTLRGVLEDPKSASLDSLQRQHDDVEIH